MYLSKELLWHAVDTLSIQPTAIPLGNNYGGAAASAVLAILPLTIIYLLLQDAFVQGQVDSAIK